MQHRETWYKRILTEKKKGIISSAIFAVMLAVAVSLWHYFSGASFEWHSISPVEAPSLLPRLFYSALVFVTLGAFLYAVGFYKFLYSFFRGVTGGYRDYKTMKAYIWGLLILAMYFVIIPVVVNVLNAVISFFYNVFNFILYLFPPVGISAVLFGMGYFIIKKINVKYRRIQKNFTR
jgi:hypothetical protein